MKFEKNPCIAKGGTNPPNTSKKRPTKPMGSNGKDYTNRKKK